MLTGGKVIYFTCESGFLKPSLPPFFPSRWLLVAPCLGFPSRTCGSAQKAGVMAFVSPQINPTSIFGYFLCRRPIQVLGMMAGCGGGLSKMPSLAGQAHGRPLLMFPCAITSFKRFASKHFSFIIYSVDRCFFGTI